MRISLNKKTRKMKEELGEINMIQAKDVGRKPEVVWAVDIKEDGKTYCENYMLLFPKYDSAINDE